MENKTFINNSDSPAQKNIRDLKTWGDPDVFQLISKAYSQTERWMKSTKAMEISGVGCVVQVTTQQGNNISEAVCFVPGVKIEIIYKEKSNEITGRYLTPIND